MGRALGTYRRLISLHSYGIHLFHNLLFRPTERYMLQDMWHSSGVWRIRLEADAEDIVGIISCHMQIVCPRLFMLEM
jgi:hypothetical protein